MTITEKQQQLVPQFSALSEWMDRYTLLIAKGKQCPALADGDKTIENNKVAAANLTFLGIVAISDPVRSDVPFAVKDAP